MAPLGLREMARGIIEIIGGKKEVAIVGKEQIEGMLPHRGKMLLLSEVAITSEEVKGKFAVTQEVCEGHAVLGDRLVFRGVDVIEMAAQTVGVSWGIQHPDFLGKSGMLRRVDGVKFSKPIFVGDSVEVAISAQKIRDRVLGGPEAEKIMIKVIARDIEVFVGKERKATVGEIELAFI